MSETTKQWFVFSFLLIIALVVLLLALSSAAEWGVICSAEDTDAVACFRNWITSGAAVLTVVAIIFAVAQVREATRQSDVGIRSTVAGLRSDLLEERDKVSDVVSMIDDEPIGHGEITDEHARSFWRFHNRYQTAVGSVLRYNASGLSLGTLPQARQLFGEAVSRFTWTLWSASVHYRDTGVTRELDVMEFYDDFGKVTAAAVAYLQALDVELGQSSRILTSLDERLFLRAENALRRSAPRGGNHRVG